MNWLPEDVVYRIVAIGHQMRLRGPCLVNQVARPTAEGLDAVLLRLRAVSFHEMTYSHRGPCLAMTFPEVRIPCAPKTHPCQLYQNNSNLRNRHLPKTLKVIKHISLDPLRPRLGCITYEAKVEHRCGCGFRYHKEWGTAEIMSGYSVLRRSTDREEEYMLPGSDTELDEEEPE